MTTLRAFGGMLFLLVLLVGAGARAGETEPLIIETADGRLLPFAVELAIRPEDQARGLMERPSLPERAGMLFDFGQERIVSFWMKNTLISLDMLFIAKDGRIVEMAERRVPLSLTPISSAIPARAVLEINGGLAERLGIHAGDHVRHRLFPY